MYKRIILLAGLILLLYAGSSYAIEIKKYNLECNLQLIDNNFEIRSPIKAQVLVKNTGSESVSLKISEKAFYNFDVKVWTIKNRAVPEKGDFAFEKETHQDLQRYKTIVLDTGEEFGKEIDLNSIFDLTETGTGVYIVQVVFYPVPKNLYRIEGIESQKMQIKINPYQQVGELLAKDIKDIDEELDKIRTADDTIDFMLRCKMKKNWEGFLRYIDAEKLMEQFPTFYKRYMKLPPSKRYVIVDEFRNYLKDYLEEDMVDYDIYQMKKQKRLANVYVMINYSYRGNIFKRKYIFYLYKKNKRWYMYKYRVENQ